MLWTSLEQPLEIIITIQHTHKLFCTVRKKTASFWFIMFHELVLMNTCNFYPDVQEFTEDDK